MTILSSLSLRELVARVRALFRRTYSEPETAVDSSGTVMLTIDISGHKILINNREVDLTASRSLSCSPPLLAVLAACTAHVSGACREGPGL